jgi:hypothetical protein
MPSLCPLSEAPPSVESEPIGLGTVAAGMLGEQEAPPTLIVRAIRTTFGVPTRSVPFFECLARRSAENVKRTSQPSAEGSEPISSRAPCVRRGSHERHVGSRSCNGRRNAHRRATRTMLPVGSRPGGADDGDPPFARRDRRRAASRWFEARRSKTGRMAKHGRERRGVARSRCSHCVGRGEGHHPHATGIHMTAHGDRRNVALANQRIQHIGEIRAGARTLEREVAARAPAAARLASIGRGRAGRAFTGPSSLESRIRGRSLVDPITT